jgi:hypothetical protein
MTSGSPTSSCRGLWADPHRQAAHVAAAKILRREHLDAAARPARPDVQVRCLADYDIALGLVDAQEVA